jgi:hypothetical protein
MGALTESLRKPLPLHPDGFVRDEKLYRLIGHDIEFDLRVERNEAADRIDALEKALEEAANALDDIAERTWDRRQHDECKAACTDASQMASGACEEARAALKDGAVP